ncbi:lipopolysaccharide transport periplasmic protein LptA [Paenalcaligenes hominis]|uniref:lipopolysaccharide transport periplasmic protein LptA n=1 Tax=Paenalcaligenes hominis TaxID=643674 RepID=UPI0035233CE8
MIKPLLLSLTLLLSFGSTATWAQAADPDTVILSDSLEYDDINRLSTFVGNVILTRGNLNLKADKIVVNETADGAQHAVATVSNSPNVLVRQESPEKFEIIKGESHKAEYNSATEQLTLVGKAVITRYVCGTAIDSISGDRVVYNKKTDTYQAVSNAPSGSGQNRVRSVARPRAHIDRAIAECQQKSH